MRAVFCFLLASVTLCGSDLRKWDQSATDAQAGAEGLQASVAAYRDWYEKIFDEIFDGNEFEANLLTKKRPFDPKAVQEAAERILKAESITNPSNRVTAILAQVKRIRARMDDRIKRYELNWGSTESYGSLFNRIKRGGDDAAQSEAALRNLIEHEYFLIPLALQPETNERYEALHKQLKNHYNTLK